MDLHLKGKIALVTGASRGLGFATARILAQEGVALALNSRNLEKLKSAADSITLETGARGEAFTGDRASQNTPDTLVRQTIESFGGLDILITNAGGPPPARF